MPSAGFEAGVYPVTESPAMLHSACPQGVITGHRHSIVIVAAVRRPALEFPCARVFPGTVVRRADPSMCRAVAVEGHATAWKRPANRDIVEPRTNRRHTLRNRAPARCRKARQDEATVYRAHRCAHGKKPPGACARAARCTHRFAKAPMGPGGFGFPCRQIYASAAALRALNFNEISAN